MLAEDLVKLEQGSLPGDGIYRLEKAFIPDIYRTCIASRFILD